MIQNIPNPYRAIEMIQNIPNPYKNDTKYP